MRGKALLAIVNTKLDRITPAYAGKSYGGYNISGGEKDHPRVCGEKPVIYQFTRRWRGSPPRMRGKVIVDWRAYSLVGITPAYAGKSFPRFRRFVEQ